MQPRKIIVMGVSGVGKTSLAQALAAHFNAVFIEGDDLHPEANVQVMRAGQPLTDEMRAPWLDAVGQAISDIDGDVMATCSALKRTYRDRLRSLAQDVLFVHLTAREALISSRLSNRQDHFMPAALLASQLATLEPLENDETHVVIDASGSQDAMFEQTIKALSNRTTP